MSERVKVPSSAELKPETRDKILDGARAAVARHGLKKLGMSDVSDAAGVSRGTLYRYFPSREELLEGLVAREQEKFMLGLFEALACVDDGEDRLMAVMEYVVRELHTHDALQRLRVSEPDFVLQTIREQFLAIKTGIGTLLGPVMVDTAPVRLGLIRPEQLTDWLVRMLASMFLIPDTDPEDMIAGLQSMYKLLLSDALVDSAVVSLQPA